MEFETVHACRAMALPVAEMSPMTGCRNGMIKAVWKSRQRRQAEDVACSVSYQLECMELCLMFDGEPTASLQIAIKGKTGAITEGI